MMKRARIVAALLVVSLCAAVRPAMADGGGEREARHRFDEAEAAYKAGHYADALAKYQAGYAAKPLPGFLINIAQCQRRLGDLKTARATYREFTLVAPDSRLVPEVKGLIAQLDAVIADLETGKDPSADEAAASGDVHATEVAAGGDVPAAEVAPPPVLTPAPPPETPVLVAAPAPAADAPAAPAHRSHARWWIWGGIAAAAIAGGIVAGVAMSSPGTMTIHAGTLGTISR
jgi:hypothetical protein